MIGVWIAAAAGPWLLILSLAFLAYGRPLAALYLALAAAVAAWHVIRIDRREERREREAGGR